MDRELADPSLYARDSDAARKLAIARGQQAQALAAAEGTWLQASEAYEAAATTSDE